MLYREVTNGLMDELLPSVHPRVLVHPRGGVIGQAVGVADDSNGGFTGVLHGTWVVQEDLQLAEFLLQLRVGELAILLVDGLEGRVELVIEQHEPDAGVVAATFLLHGAVGGP